MMNKYKGRLTRSTFRELSTSKKHNISNLGVLLYMFFGANFTMKIINYSVSGNKTQRFHKNKIENIIDLINCDCLIYCD